MFVRFPADLGRAHEERMDQRGDRRGEPLVRSCTLTRSSGSRPCRDACRRSVCPTAYQLRSVCSISPSPPGATITSAVSAPNRHNAQPTWSAPAAVPASCSHEGDTLIFFSREVRYGSCRGTLRWGIARFLSIRLTLPLSRRRSSRRGHCRGRARLAACVNILPGMISHYWWEGEVERGEEVVAIFKTRASLADDVRQAVRDNHSHDVPAIVVIAARKRRQRLFRLDP